MAYKIAGIDVHKRMLAVVVSDVEGMREGSGVECWRDGAVEHGRSQRDVAWEEECRGDGIEETAPSELVVLIPRAASCVGSDLEFGSVHQYEQPP